MSTRPSYVPVEDEPNHCGRWKNDWLRIVDVQFPPHKVSLYHQHVHYGVYVAITPIISNVKLIDEPDTKLLNMEQGEVFWSDQTINCVIHAVEAQDKAFRIIEVELLKDTPKVDNEKLPVHDKISGLTLMNSDTKARVYRVKLSQVVGRVAFTFPTKAALVTLKNCTISIENSDALNDIMMNGKAVCNQEMELHPGDDVVLQPGHCVLSCNSTETEFIVVEVF